MLRLFAALFVACAIMSSASAQIIYEPVRYQYGGQTPFYYGGSDPEMFRFAHSDYSQAHNGFIEAHGNVMTHREVSYRRPHVYVDRLPRADASVWGYTADDARNDAYQNAARYFRMKDIVAQATVDESGAWHVAPQACSDHVGTIEIKPYVKPVATPQKVFIFPKGLLDKKLGDEPKTVASAQ
jgi:hypothetical protein